MTEESLASELLPGYYPAMQPNPQNKKNHGMHDVTSKPAGSRASRRKVLAVAALIIAASIFAYHGLASNDFIDAGDDEPYILENPHVQNGLSWSGVKWAFTTMHAGNWHPLTWLSHMLDASLFGPKAGGHHLMSLALHTMSALLLFWFFFYTTGRLWAGCLAALLFAVHPLHVESVAWAAERKDVLSAFFWFATMLMYAFFAKRGGWAKYAVVLVLFALGLMAKPMLVTLPLVLLLLDYWPLERITNIPPLRLVVEKLPLFGLSAASCVMTLSAQTVAIATLGEVDLITRLANAALSCGIYIRQMFWPVDLSIFYPYSLSFSELRMHGAIAGVLLLAATAAAIFLGRTRRYLAVGWLWYLITLIPVIGIVQVGWQAHADRYTYIPYVGLSIVVIWTMADAVNRRRSLRLPAAVAAFIVIAVLCLLTAKQTAYWKDSLTLNNHALAVTEKNAWVHRNLAYLFTRKGELDKAVEQARKAIDADTQWYEGYVILGRALMEQGKLDEAIAAGRRGVELGPHEPLTHFHLAESYARRGDYEQAVAGFKTALSFEEHYAAWNDMGICLKALGRFDEAEQAYRRAVDLRPDDAGIRQNLGVLLLDRGRKAEAAEQLRVALALQPASQLIHQLLEQASAPDR